MRLSLSVATLALASSSVGIAQPLDPADRATVQSLPRRFTEGWLHNSRNEVMGIFAPDAVFIPHDGVKPHIGKAAMTQFWFPSKGAAGTVTAFTMTADGVSGESGHAIVWGKSDLHWQNKTTAYQWPGYYLMAAERRHSKWLVTHLMSSDQPPTSGPIEARK